MRKILIPVIAAALMTGAGAHAEPCLIQDAEDHLHSHPAPKWAVRIMQRHGLLPDGEPVTPNDVIWQHADCSDPSQSTITWRFPGCGENGELVCEDKVK